MHTSAGISEAELIAGCAERGIALKRRTLDNYIRDRRIVPIAGRGKKNAPRRFESTDVDKIESFKRVIGGRTLLDHGLFKAWASGDEVDVPRRFLASWAEQFSLASIPSELASYVRKPVSLDDPGDAKRFDRLASIADTFGDTLAQTTALSSDTVSQALIEVGTSGSIADADVDELEPIAEQLLGGKQFLVDAELVTSVRGFVDLPRFIESASDDVLTRGLCVARALRDAAPFARPALSKARGEYRARKPAMFNMIAEMSRLAREMERREPIEAIIVAACFVRDDATAHGIIRGCEGLASYVTARRSIVQR